MRNRIKLAGATAVAFTGGILLASGLDLPAGSHAATLIQTPPARQDIKPVADLSQAFISIAESVTPAVVAIETERAPTARGRRQGGGEIPEEFREMFPFRFPEEGVPRQSSGSGFIITDDGYIVTNNHVVEGSDKITVILQDNRQLSGRLVGADPNTDIAVVKVEGNRFPSVRMGRSDDARIGEWVLAIGNPLDLGTTVTSGIVSAKGRGNLNIIRQSSGSAWAIEDFIQTDAPINPGNSGGPLVNLRGEVVGVNTAIASRTGFYAGYGFAVPIDLARRIADDLIRYGKVRRPALGVSVTEVRPEDAEAFRLPRIEGVVAQDFPDGSAARRAGLRQGDVIVAVNGRRVEHVGQFQRIIAGFQPGDDVTLDVIRYGEQRRIQVELAEAPTDPQPRRQARAEREEPAADPASGTKLGVAVTPLNAQLARQYGLQEQQGLVVTRVEPYGPAGRAGLPEGTRILAVDGQAVREVADFRRALDRKRAGEVVSLQVQFPQGGQNSIINIRLPA